jgi:hypothetical protein
VRERNTPSHNLQAGAISELEMWLHYRGLCTTGDVALLVREGYLLDLGAGPTLTPRGIGEQTKIEAQRAPKKKRTTADAEATT